jgi:hypothetical protein
VGPPNRSRASRGTLCLARCRTSGATRCCRPASTPPTSNGAASHQEGRAILQLVSTRITLGKTLTEISNQLRASPSDELSTTRRANAQGPTVSG